MVSHAKEEFAGDRKIAFIEFKGLELLYLEQTFLLRFKKLNRKLRSSNYPTQQALDFENQLEIPGFPPEPTRLNIGYVPNLLWTEIEAIYIVCPSIDGIEWSLRLDEEQDLIVPAEATVDFISTKPRLRLKQKAISKSEGE